MYSELKAKGLEARLIAFRESADLLRRTVKERGYVVPSLLDANGDVTGRLYGVFGPPTVYFVDRQRSEERRVGKECRSGGLTGDEKKNRKYKRRYSQGQCRW